MKVLSIRQPWAAAIIYGGKNIENRTWNTKFRGRFLVHASLKVDKNAPDYVWDIFEKHFDEKEAFGGIIGSVELIDVIQAGEEQGMSEMFWFQGPKGFVLKDPEALPFKRMKGKLNFFEEVGP